MDQICQHNSLIFIKWWRIKNNSSQIGLKNTTHIHHTVNTTLIVTELYNYKFQLVGGSLRWTSNEYGTLWLSEQQLCIIWYFSEKKTFWSFMYTDYQSDFLTESLVLSAIDKLDRIDTPTWFFLAWSAEENEFIFRCLNTEVHCASINKFCYKHWPCIKMLKISFCKLNLIQ